MVHRLLVELLVSVVLLAGFWRLFKFTVPFVVALAPEKSSWVVLDVIFPLVKTNCRIAPGWVVMMVVAVPLTVNPCWIFAIACWVALLANISAWVLDV